MSSWGGAIHLILAVLVWNAHASPVPSESSARDAAIIAAQRVVKLRDPKAKARLRALAEAGGGRVLGGGARFFVLRPRETASAGAYDALLETLAKDSAVETVLHDTPSFPRRSHVLATPTDAPVGKRDGVPPPPEPGCRIYPRCGTSNPAWAKLQVGADLAETLVEREASRGKEYARVAVVDSGFDTKGQAAGIRAKSFETLPGHDSSGDKDIDPDGHGTAVAGMIAGKTTGVTHQVHLKVFRVTEKNAGGSVSTALLAAAIEKACETSDVVNVSWGSFYDEIGLGKLEDELWYQKAAESGCLVIKSSGNGGYRRKAETKGRVAVPIDAPFLSVAASDEFSDEATFSTTGGIMAPGAGVFSMLSAQHEYGSATEKSACTLEKSRIGPVNGTSFSAPLVAGIAGQVITILRSRGVLPKAPGAKVSLIKSILLASAEWSKEAKSRRPVANALTAALIARSVPSDGKTDSASLIAGAQKSDVVQKACAAAPEDCTQEKDCSLRKACLNRLRFQFHACVPSPPGMKAAPELDARLFASFKHEDERELLVQLIDRLPPGGPLAKESIAELTRQWDALVDEDRVNTGSFGRATNLLHSARRSDIAKDFDLPNRFRQLMRSYGLLGAFHFSQPLGTWEGQAAREEQAGRVVDLFRSLPVQEQIHLVGEIPYTGFLLPQANFLYFLHANRDTLDKGTKAALEAKLRELAEQWFDGKLNEDSFLINHSLALETIVSYLPDGAARIREAMKAEPTAQNINILRFGVRSKTALGKDRLGLVEKLVEHPKLRSAEFQYLLNDAIAMLLEDGDVASIERVARRSLLENPHAVLPVGSTAMFASVITPRQKALGKEGFFPAFVGVNVKQGIARLSQKETDYLSNAREIRNIMRSLQFNSLMPAEARKELFAGPVGKDMEKLVAIAAANVVADEEFTSPYRAVVAGSLYTVERALDEQQMFIDGGFQAPLRRALEALKNDVLARPARYSQEMRHQIRRLYGLDE